MDKLLTLWRGIDRDGRDSLAKRCGTTVNHMRNVAYGQKTCGESLCINIERATKGAVRCEDLRPDVDWGYLRGTAGEPAPPAETGERGAA